MQSIANFLFEVGMLKRTPRSGLQFLGSGSESVAEHAFRVTCIAYVLARLEPDADEARLIKLCLLHDVASVLVPRSRASKRVSLVSCVCVNGSLRSVR